MCWGAEARPDLISVGTIRKASLSLVPEQAKHVGISYEQLVDILVKEALA